MSALAPPLRAVHLDAGQHRVLWRDLGLGERPVVLAVADHGATLAERDAADRAARARLRAQGLADARDRPDPDLADALAVLRAPTHELDVRRWSGGPRRAVLAATSGGLGVVAALDDADGLHLRASPVATPDDLADLLLAATTPTPIPVAVPTARPWPGPPVRLPADAVLGVAPERRMGRLRAAGVSPIVLERLAALWAEPPERVLQCGAARRDAGGRRRRASRVLTVVDAPAGRVAVEHRAEHLWLRPLDRSGLRRALRDLVREGGATAPVPGGGTGTVDRGRPGGARTGTDQWTDVHPIL